jgi:folate-binding protein YgfZ
VLHTVFCIPSRPNTYLISHESGAGHIAPLAALLPPFRLRSKIKIRDVSAEWDVWSAWGAEASPAPSSSWRFGSGGAAERIWSWGEMAPLGLGDGEVGCWDLRAGFGPAGMGRQLFVPKGQKPSLLASHDLAPTDEYNLRRMVLGVPEGSAEVIPGSALPLESDMDIHGGVDVRKGCYLGQELTVRTYHTGATRKRILPIYLYPLESGPGALASSPLSLDLGALPALAELKGGAQKVDIMYTPPAGAASKKARSAGKLLALSELAPGVGLGLVRLEWAGRAWDGEGTLSVEVDGQKYGVWVGKGEGYAAALAATPPPRVHDDEEDMAHPQA